MWLLAGALASMITERAPTVTVTVTLALRPSRERAVRGTPSRAACVVNRIMDSR